MKRAIVDFHRDSQGDWVADLDCGHGQHVRHRPPFVNRPWVVDEHGREKMVGTGLDCVRCQRMEWPEHASPYRRTPEFDETTLPTGLTADHATKRGVWARLHVLAGAVCYHVGEPINRSMRLEAGMTAVVVPEVRHRVEANGTVRLFVEFARVGRLSSPTPNSQGESE